MNDTRNGWFFVVDGRIGRLMQASVVPPGRLHVEQRDQIEPEPDEAEHRRPSALKGRSGHSYAHEGHDTEDRTHRFAKQVAAWLEQRCGQHEIETLTLFAAPRLLGELRKVTPAGFAQRVAMKNVDLATLSPSQLMKHPAIERLVEHQA